MEFELKEIEGISYIEEGEGDTIVLLHGLFGALSNFKDLIEHFRKTHKVSIPMLPLYTASFRNANLPKFQEFLEKFISLKNYEDIILVGNSLGGHLGLMYTLDNMPKVRSLVLTGSSGLYESAFGDTFPKRGNYDYIKKKVEDTFHSPETATKELVDDVFAVVNDRMKALNTIAIAKSAIRHNLKEELHKYELPTLLIWGKQDKVTPAWVGEEFSKLMPQAELHMLDECGHAPMMEHPDTFNEILENYLAKLPESVG